MSTTTRKALIIVSLAVAVYLLYGEFKKNSDLEAAKAKAKTTSTDEPEATTNNIVVGDHTGETVQTGGFKPAKMPVMGIAVGEMTGAASADVFYK